MQFAGPLFMLACAVAVAEDKPDWVNGSSASYPKNAYLTGVGHAPTQQKAAEEARAEIAEALSVNVEKKLTASARETTDGTSTSFSQEISNEVNASTSKVLDGVEIAQYWQGPDGYYALAVLDRGHSLKIMGDKLAEIDRDFADLSAALAKSDGKFSRLRTALRLLRIARHRRGINEDYRILDPDGKGIPPPASYSDVLSQARKAVSALTVQVAVEGPNGEHLTSHIIDGLSAYGLRAVEKGDRPADIVIDAKAQGEALPADNLTWFWAKGSFLVKMRYGSTGEVFARFEESGQDAAGDPGSSVEVTLDSLADKTAVHVFHVVMSAQLADD